MEEHSDILSKLIRRKKPALPENFFESFGTDLSAQLNHTGNEAEPDFGKTQKPAVPNDFFQNFYATLQAELESQHEFSELDLIKRKRPEVPEGFESDFRKKLVARIKTSAPDRQKNSTRGRILKIS